MGTPINGSVQLGFSILKQFAVPAGEYTLTELARRMDLPVPTVHRFLRTLVSVGALVRLPGGRYGLGPELADLGSLVSYEKLLAGSAGPVLASLAGRFHAVAHLSVFESGMVKFISKHVANADLRVSSKVNGLFEAYCTASGKVLLAALATPELDDYLCSGELVPFTEHTLTDRHELLRELTTVRQGRLASDRQEFQDNVVCWAVPVQNSVQRTVAALSISFAAATSPSAEQAGAMVAELARSSRAITEALATRQEPATRGQLLPEDR
jgi:IclR family transcriptional regulator, acetate operon repressor